MKSRDPFNWYETSLSVQERKSRGHFSTPPHLVSLILDACGYTSDRDLSTLRVLDPACGSGNFLVGAAQRLLSSGLYTEHDHRQRARLLQRNLWGFDPDPVACSLTEMQLRQVFTQTTMSTDSAHQTSKTPINRRSQDRVCNQILRRLHIHQADSLTFPWENCANVDLFLANPPYLASKNTDLSGYLSAHQRGQSDSYLLFLELALCIVRPGGWIGLVLPDPVLARTNAAEARRRLLAETTVHHLWHLADVFTAHVGAVVLVAQKCSPHRIHAIQWIRGQWQHSSTPKMNIQHTSLPSSSITVLHSGTIAQDFLYKQPGAEFRYLLSGVQETLIEQLHSYIHTFKSTGVPETLTSLGQFVQIRRGEEIGKDSALLCTISPSEREQEASSWLPVLRGGVDIRPYGVPRACCWINHSTINKVLARYLAPKLLVIKSVGRLQASLDKHGHVVLQTLYLLQLQPQRPALWQGYFPTSAEIEDELYFLLALLNSRLLGDYVSLLHTAYKLVQPQIEQHVLSNLPIPTITTHEEKTQIIHHARLLMHACGETSSVVELKGRGNIPYNALYEEQEQMICALYARALQPEVDIDANRTSPLVVLSLLPLNTCPIEQRSAADFSI